MATPINPLGPAYDLLSRVLLEEHERNLALLREAGPDVYTETDDGGAATVVHDPAQLAFPGIAGSVDQTERLTRLFENYDYAAQGQWAATVEQRFERLFRMIDVATERLNGEHADQPSDLSIEDMRRRIHRPGNPFR